jgi:lipoyl(octanoyl) transferase
MNQPSEVRILAAAGVGYESGRAWQLATAAEVRAARDVPPGGTLAAPGEAIALIEHAPVYTMGARGGRASVRLPLEALPAPLVDTDRGGDITWHGPGQLVAYPILDLRRRGLGAAAYIEALEGLLLDTLRAFGIHAELVEGRRGVWVGGDKIAALGIRVQGGVSLHGIALNVSPDLAWFDAIVPCGLDDAGVTSMSRVLGRTVRVAEARKAMMRAFERRFEARLVTVSCEAATAALAGREQVSA